MLSDSHDKSLKNTNNTKSVLIIGFGTMGKIHATKIKEIPVFGKITVVDTNEQRLQEARNANYTAYTNLDTAYQNNVFDVVVITTNTAAHYAYIEKVLLKHEQLNLKPPALFVEKPIVATQDEAKKVQDLLLKHGYSSKYPLMCGYLLRESKAVTRLIEKIKQDNETINTIKIKWQKKRTPNRPSAGIIQDETTHSIDLIQYILQQLGIHQAAKNLTILSATRSRDIVNTVEQDLIYPLNDENRTPFAEIQYTFDFGDLKVEGFSSFLKAPQERSIVFSGKNKSYTLTFDKDGQDFCDTEAFKTDKITASWESFAQELQSSKKPSHVASLSACCNDVILTNELEEQAKLFLQKAIIFSPQPSNTKISNNPLPNKIKPWQE